MKHLTIGITAHVDSGKTTLSEAILYHTGKIRSLGRVDNQTAFLDTDAIERDRGITIFSHQADFTLGETTFTLLDTPGHVDFSTETERTMQVLDYAILVISGTDGVQSHTETLWRLLERYQIPVFLFINKMDLQNAEKDIVLTDLKQHLSDACIDFSQDTTDNFFESAAFCEESLMEEYLERGFICQESLRSSIAARRIFPCFFGSALKLSGVDTLLHGLTQYTQIPSYSDTFCAKIFKISVDDKGNRLSHLKVTGGNLHVRDIISYHTSTGKPISEKISQIRFYSGARFQASDTAETGSVCAVTGLSHTFTGQGLGAEPDAIRPVLEPVMCYALRLPPKVCANTALASLAKLEEEDPALHIIWNETLQEIQVQLMGEVQLEVLQKRIADRFGWFVTFDTGKIAYKETIAAPVEGVGHYEPLCHYAEVHLLLEPLPRGSGLQFLSDCREDDLDKNWQRLILTHLAEKMHRGVLTGSPITDIKITLCAGKAHLKHTEGGDFRQATYRAVRNGLRKAESILLEPWYQFTLEVPADNIGRAMSDIQQKNGRFKAPESDSITAVLCGYAPVAEMCGYQSVVTSYTKGKGRLTCTLRGYEPCQNSDAVISSIGYDCDNDLENTADSVFCAHGAGFLVKWDEVEQYMHLPSCLTPQPEPKEPLQLIQRAKAYAERVAEDAELMAIFERTYGKINRDPRRAFRKPPRESEYKTAATRKNLPVNSAKEYLLVDGYNIIFAWDELNTLAQNSLDTARSRLIHTLCNYQGYRQCELILVFDAYKVNGAHREVEQCGGIQIVYTKEAETADAYIEKATQELCKNYRVRVATSDGMEQIIILGHGAYRISAEEFHQEVQQAETAIREYIASLNTK